MSNKKKTIDELLNDKFLLEDKHRYKIPENWIWTSLGAITNVVGGGTPKSSVEEYYSDGHIPWLTPADLSGYNQMYIQKGRKNITELGLAKSSAKILPVNTVLLSSRAPIGYVVIASNEVCTNQGFKSFVPSPVYYPQYLYWYLIFSRNYLESMASGTTFKELSGSKSKEIPFPLPPLNEQKRIAEKVDRLLGKVDEAKRLIEEAKETFELRRAAILDKAFSGELTSEWRQGKFNEDADVYIKYLKTTTSFKSDRKIVEAYDLPKGWKWAKLGDLFHVQVGSTPSRKKVEYWNGEHPWISSGEVKFNEIYESRETVTDLGARESRLKLAPKGAVLFGMIGEGKTRGQVALLNIDSYHNQNTASIWVSKTKINTLYVYYWLISQYSKNRQNSAGNNQPAYNKSRVQELLIPVAPLEEINVITDRVHRMLEIENEIQELLFLEEKVSTIKRFILSKALSGELGTNDPSEESAIVLLKSVLQEN